MRRVSDSDLRLLRIFTTVAEARGFAAAQVELNISVSSISSYITALEQRLGVRLCHRGRAGFALTDKGQVIYHEAKRLFASLDDFAAKAGAVKGRLSGTLRIGLVDCTASDENAPMPRAIRRFNERDHDVRIELTVAPPADLQRGVLDGQLHLAIACFPVEVAGLVSEPLYEEANSVYCGADHPLFDRDATLEDIRGCRVIARSYWRGADLTLLGVERAAATVDIMEAQAILVLSGAYLGYLPDHYVAGWVRAGRLRCLLPEPLSYVAPFSMVTRRGGAGLPLVREFVEDVRASLAKPVAQLAETPLKASRRRRPGSAKPQPMLA